jgi:hypothetical protein
MRFSGEPRSSDRETEASLFYRKPRPEANAVSSLRPLLAWARLYSSKVEDLAKRHNGLQAAARSLR